MKQRRGFFYGWTVLAIAFVIMAVGYALRNTFSVFYPAIVEEFGWGRRGSTALMFSITILVYGWVAPVAGGLVDRFEPRLVLSVGTCIVGGGIALCSLASTQWQFYLLYGVMVAIGLSMIGAAPLMAIISNWFVKKRGLVFGILSAGFGVSLVAAPIAQFLISGFGWQAAYVIIGLFAIALIVPLCILFVRRSPREKGLLPDGLLQTSSEPQPLDEPQGAAGLGGERTSTAGTLAWALKTRHFWLLFLMAFCILGVGEQIAIAHQVYFFRDVGYEPMRAATIYSVFGVVFVVGNLCAYYSDRLGREKVFIASCLLSAGAVSLLFLITDTSQPWMPFLFAVCLGLGLGAAAPVLFATVADIFQGRYFGSIMGCVILGFSLGGAIAPWLAGFLHDKTGSYFVTFLILLGCLVASAGLMWLVAPRKIRPVPRQAPAKGDPNNGCVRLG
ncbi:MAG TPA: MFS transporter [Dehalococcoidia bacterium]|nr:MFS transporter [Dehalococcoidia bacterium]